MSLVRFYCPDHGHIGSFPSRSLVLCGEKVVGPKGTKKCRKRALPRKKVAA